MKAVSALRSDTSHLDHKKTSKVSLSILKPGNLYLALKAFYKVKTCHQGVFSATSPAQECNTLTSAMML